MTPETKKPVHDKTAKENFTPGMVYRVSLNQKELYEAEVVKFHGGCWATVKVTKLLLQGMESSYHEGMMFDIKVANYDVVAI